MIKQVRLRNFQSHKDTTLNFGSGVNIIVGEGNDIGKTSIVRAMELVAENRPLGTGYISNFQKDAAIVDIVTENAHVQRIRGERENKYVVTHKEFDKESINAGMNPPEPVVDALNFLPVNIQSQITLPFLVLDSPGAVARHIRELANLDDIDKIIQLLKSKKRTKTEQLETSQEHLKETQDKLDEVSKIDIEQFEFVFSRLKDRMENSVEMGLYANGLRPRIAMLQEIEETRIDLPKDIDQILEKSNKLIEENAQIVDKIGRLKTLIRHLQKIKPIYLPKNIEEIVDKGHILIANDAHSTQYIEEIGDLITELTDVQRGEIHLPKNISTILTTADELADQYNITEERCRTLRCIIEQLGVIEHRKVEIQRAIDTAQKTFDKSLGQLTECPMCTSELTEDTKEKLLLEYKS